MNDGLLGDPNKTRKIRALPAKTELDLAQEKYNKTFEAFIKEPTGLNQKAFDQAKTHLLDVKEAYNRGWELLQERAKRLGRAIYEITFGG